MTTATRQYSEPTLEILGRLAAMPTPEGVKDDQKLHGAIFEHADQDHPGTPDRSLGEVAKCQTTGEDNGGFLDDKIAELLDQIDQGFQADDATHFEKLTIARKYGPMLLELKEIAPHGTFKQKLKERFPKISYAKCNRWMFLASHETEVAAAIEQYPDVSWGPKKMVDFLKGVWTPEPEDEDDWLEEDEDDYSGFVKDNDLDNGSVDVLPFTATTVKTSPPSSVVPPGATAGPVVQAVRTPPKSNKTTGKKGKKVQVSASKTKSNTSSPPTTKRTQYEVEVRLGFKMSVPEGTTADEITSAFRVAENWRVGINTPFEYEMTEKAVVVSHVKPWYSLGEFEPEAIPE